MKGFILAAGFGKRLAPITDTVPKPVWPVANIPAIGFALRLFAYYGIHDVVINLHHLGHVIRDTLGDGSVYGVRIIYSDEPEILGTGGGIRQQQRVLSDGPFVVINSDTVIDVDLGAVLEEHCQRGALSTMVLREVDPADDYGHIEIDAAGRIRKILGQGHDHRGLRQMMFTGVHVLDPRFLEYIPPNIETCINRYGYVKALQHDENLCAFVSNRFWADTGTPSRYLQVHRDILRGEATLPHMPQLGTTVSVNSDTIERGIGAQLHGNNLFGSKVTIGQDAQIGPDCVLGSRVRVGQGASVENAVVFEGVHIEPGQHIKNAIVSKQAILPITTVS